MKTLRQKNELYDILGLERMCSKEDIRKAYKNAAIKYHPDKLRNNATEEEKSMFIKIQNAYEVLSDEKRRAYYNEFGNTDELTEINQFEEMSNLFDLLFKFQNNMKRSLNIEPIHIQVELDLCDVIFGVKKNIIFERKVLVDIETNKTVLPEGIIFLCEKCKGVGSYTNTVQNGFIIMQNTQNCEKCKALGYVNFFPNKYKFATKKCKFNYNFNKGVKNNEQIILRNLGNINPFESGHDGDVVLIIKYNTDPKYKFDSAGNLVYVQTVSIFESITGTEFDFTHLDGRTMRIKIPPIKPNFQKIVKYNGLPQHLKNGDCVMSDLIILFEIIYPEISEDQKKIIMTNFDEFYHNIDARKEVIFLNFDEKNKNI